MKNNRKPSEFTCYPWGCVFRNAESEIVAQNIMRILKRNGDVFREIGFEEYKTERNKDGNFTASEESYFIAVSQYCATARNASLFCKEWKNIFNKKS